MRRRRPKARIERSEIGRKLRVCAQRSEHIAQPRRRIAAGNSRSRMRIAAGNSRSRMRIAAGNSRRTRKDRVIEAQGRVGGGRFFIQVLCAIWYRSGL